MATIEIHIHKSLQSPNSPKTLKINTSEKETLLDALKSALAPYEDIHSQIFEGDEIRQGILLIYGMAELVSLGALEMEVEEDMSIKVVPTLHGG